MYEPTYGEGEKAQEAENTGTENDTSGSDVLEVGKLHHRVGSTEWCTCGNCIVMTSDIESVCCHELPKVSDKMVELCEEICITSSQRLHTIVLDEEILKIALLSLHDTLRKGPLSAIPPNR